MMAEFKHLTDQKIIVSDGTDWGSEEWYQARWDSVPQDVKEKVLNHLRKLSPKMLSDLSEASKDSWFHFGAGMNLRNYLREVVRDDELPEAPYPNGDSARNWDDYYRKALEAVL